MLFVDNRTFYIKKETKLAYLASRMNLSGSTLREVSQEKTKLT